MTAQVALITGGAGGVGMACARALCAAGHQVALLGHGREGLARARQALGEGVVAVRADVTSRPEVEEAVREVRRLLGPPTVLVHAAGVAPSQGLVPPDDAVWERTMAVNATGAWIVATAVLPGMREAGHGRIVNVASTAALRGYRYVPAYVASKHALLGLTRALAEDLRGSGITVNALCPGFLDTPMTDRSVAGIVAATGRPREAVRKTLAAMNASGRLLDPEEVAVAVLGLLGAGERTGEVVTLE